jgi:hypothetical protein
MDNFSSLLIFGIGFTHEAVFFSPPEESCYGYLFCLQNASWFRSLLSASRNKRMISSGLCLFCFIVSCFVYSKLLTRFGPVFQAAASSFFLKFLAPYLAVFRLCK